MKMYTKDEHETAKILSNLNFIIRSSKNNFICKEEKISWNKVMSPNGNPCPNCNCTLSTLWRSCILMNGNEYLCNACGLRYKKGKFCPLCFKVYYDADTNKIYWMQCLHCYSWTHKICLKQVAEKNGGLSNPHILYMCRFCKM